VEQHDGVPGAEVVLHGPLDGEGGLVGEIDGDGDAPVRGGRVGPGQRGEEEARGGGLDRGRLRRRREPHRRRGRGDVSADGGVGRHGVVGEWAGGGESSEERRARVLPR